MKVTFLGTNGWYNYENHETSCVFIEAKKVNLIFDLGSGIKNLKKINFTKKPTYIFLSHLHLDHIIGIHYLSNYDSLDTIENKMLIMAGGRGKRLRPFTNKIPKPNI